MKNSLSWYIAICNIFFFYSVTSSFFHYDFLEIIIVNAFTEFDEILDEMGYIPE